MIDLASIYNYLISTYKDLGPILTAFSSFMIIYFAYIRPDRRRKREEELKSINDIIKIYNRELSKLEWIKERTGTHQFQLIDEVDYSDIDSAIVEKINQFNDKYEECRIIYTDCRQIYGRIVRETQEELLPQTHFPNIRDLIDKPKYYDEFLKKGKLDDDSMKEIDRKDYKKMKHFTNGKHTDDELDDFYNLISKIFVQTEIFNLINEKLKEIDELNDDLQTIIKEKILTLEHS